VSAGDRAVDTGDAFDADVAARIRSRSRLRLVLALIGLIALNVLAYLAMGTAQAQALIRAWEGSAYLGSFLLALVTNATVAVPIPYNPIVFQLMQASDFPWIIAITTAAGATLGETLGYLAGRAGSGMFTGTRFGRWVAGQVAHPVRAWLVLFAVSAPPFPAFDIAGLAAGSVGVRAWIFYSSVFTGRLLRFLLFAAAAAWVW
jgi:membrane protein YqaA with SNARE-associated domain